MFILETIKHTPTWVIILFFSLLYLGFMQSKDREVSIQRVLILPIVMIILSLTGIISAFGIYVSNLSIWIICTAIATIITKKILPSKNISYEESQKTFLIQGSWIPMIFILITFFVKYTVGYMIATNSQMISEPSVIYLVCIIYGIISGIFLARTLAILKAKA